MAVGGCYERGGGGRQLYWQGGEQCVCSSTPRVLCSFRRHWRCLLRHTAAASAVNAVSVSTAAATYQPPWSWSVAPQKSILVKIPLNRKSILVKRLASMARRRECLSAYLRICKSGQQQKHKKSRKIKKESLDPVWKKMFLRLLMHTCVSVIF